MSDTNVDDQNSNTDTATTDDGNVGATGDEQQTNGVDQSSADTNTQDQGADDKGQQDQSDRTAGDDQDTDSDAPVDVGALRIPEGFERDEQSAAAFGEVASELELTQKQAQKLVDLQAKLIGQQAEKQAAVFKEQVQKWEDEARKDPEIGGVKFDEKAAMGRKAIAAFGNSKLVEAFNTTGLGSHPEMIRFMYRIGQAIQEDKLDLGGANPESQTSAADRMFPGMAEQNTS